MARRRPPLRIGILTDRATGHEGWELRLFDRLMADARLDLAALLVHPRPYGQSRASPLLDLVSRLDRRLFARQPPYRPKHFDAPSQKPHRIFLPDEPELSTARRVPGLAGLDLVLRLVPAGLPDALLADIPFGEWAFSAGRRSDRADWSYVREVAAGAPLAGLELAVRQAGRAPRSLASVGFNIKFSAARNAAFVRERVPTLLVRELGRLADTRRLPAGVPAADMESAAPGVAETGAYLSRLVRAGTARAARALAQRAGFDAAVWTLYSGEGTIEDFEPRSAVEIPSAGTIRADPFLFTHDGQRYVFYESYGRREKKAHIAVGRLADEGIEPLGTALAGDTHLSFPFVFREGNDIFMMPETHQARRVEIWRCTGFPLEWELHATALEGSSAADTTLFRHQGRWWLLSNLADGYTFEDHCSELHAFEVDGPKLSRVVPHARNPVVIGSAVARNAGRVFCRNGRLFRPSQNNSHGIYGYGLNIMEILRIDRHTYEERLLRTIVPDFGRKLVGCHHFDADDAGYILDARLTA